MVAIGATLSAAARGHCRLDGWVWVFFLPSSDHIFFQRDQVCVHAAWRPPDGVPAMHGGGLLAGWLSASSLSWVGSIVPYGRLFRVPPAAAQHCWPFVWYLAYARTSASFLGYWCLAYVGVFYLRHTIGFCVSPLGHWLNGFVFSLAFHPTTFARDQVRPWLL